MRNKREKFVELAEARMARVLIMFRLLGNLSNRNNYEFSDADITKIISTLEAEIRTLKIRFRTVPTKLRNGFKLEG